MPVPSSSCRTSPQDHIFVRFRGAQFGTYAARRQPSYNDTIEEVRQMIFKSDPSIRWRELQLRAELEGVPAVLSSQVWPRLFAHIESVELVFPTTLPPTQATCLSTKTQQRQARVRDSRPAHRRKIVRQADIDLTLSDAEDGDLEEPHPMVVEQDHSDADHDPDADQDQDLDADKASPVPPRVAHVSPTPQKRRRVDPSVLFSARKNLAPRALVLRSDDEDEDEREYEPQDDVELENETEHQDDAEPVDDTDTGPNHAGVFPSFDDHMRLEREQGKSYARQKDLPWVVPPAHRQRAITAYLAAGGGSNDNDSDDGDNGDKLGLLSARERHWVAKRCQRTGGYDPTNWTGRPPRVLSSGRELYDALVRAHVGSRGHRSGVSTWRSIKVPYDLPPSRPFIQSWVKLCPKCNLK